ncbi:MAG TPA: tetratricopeptide repeat protein [Candidatus Sulfotelmatobacter sp.]|nr:tetratricopeptide repeat protein [Candidatus Sulfotelmatobacter sp.]
MVAPLRASCSLLRLSSVLCVFLLAVSLSFAAPGQQLTPSSPPSTAELKARAESGDASAQQQLSQFLLRGDSAVPGYDLALAWLRAAAQSDPRAQFLLGYLYEHGQGVPQDYAKAAENYRAAALQHHPSAENNLGLLYQRGQGVPKDMDKAFEWFSAAAQHGNPVAQCHLAVLYSLGSGTVRDYKEAAKWFRAAADSGFPEAQNSLGIYYYIGLGVAMDYHEAARWLRLAAQQGLPDAETNLAFLYEQGKGVPLDYVAAYTWYSRAIAAGDLTAKPRLKSLSLIMSRKQLDRATALVEAQVATPPRPAPTSSSAGSPYVPGP